MSNYTSENTHVLAMHTKERFHPNTRMLLHHEFENGRAEFVIGSYFTAVWNGTCYEYSWDWGHYFRDFLDAAHYWEREVLWSESELFEVSDEAGLNGCTLQVSKVNGGWMAQMYDKDGAPMTYNVSGFESKAELLEAFARHRPTLTLESVAELER